MTNLNGLSVSTVVLKRSWLYPFAFTLISFEENRGVSAARNACVAKAKGRLLYFSDDDALLEPDTLLKHIQFHYQRQPCAAIGWVNWEYQSDIEYMHPRQVGYWNLHGINTSMPKAIFDEAGGFPEWLKSYGHEDVLLGYLLFKKGYRCEVLPAPVRHLGANPMRGLQLDKARLAGQNAVQVVHRYPELAFRLGVHPALLRIKRSVVWWLRPLGDSRVDGELAYIQGALEEWQKVKQESKL
jgi:glycosyltransferase involved in cell wall biosynthesis